MFNIDHSKVESFKNWFFGRPSINLDLMDDESIDNIDVHLATEADFPLNGDPDVKYYVIETGDTYRYINGAYQVVDVYMYGLTQEYRDSPRRVTAKTTVIDPTWNIPSIDARVINPNNAALATLYNVMALTTDLEQIRYSKVYGYKTTLMDVLQQGNSDDKETNVTTWFRREHAMLHRLLVSSQCSKLVQHKPVVDVLFKHGYILTWDDNKDRAVFKFNDFCVYL